MAESSKKQCPSCQKHGILIMAGLRGWDSVQAMNFSWAAAARRIPARAPVPAHQRDSERSRPGGETAKPNGDAWEDLGSKSDFLRKSPGNRWIWRQSWFAIGFGRQAAGTRNPSSTTGMQFLGWCDYSRMRWCPFHPQLLPHKGLGKWALTRPVKRWSKTILLWLSLWWFLIVIVIMDDYGTLLLWCSFWLLLCLLFSARGLTVRGACWHSLSQKAGWFWPEEGRYELRCPSKSIKSIKI